MIYICKTTKHSIQVEYLTCIFQQIFRLSGKHYLNNNMRWITFQRKSKTIYTSVRDALLMCSLIGNQYMFNLTICVMQTMSFSLHLLTAPLYRMQKWYLHIRFLSGEKKTSSICGRRSCARFIGESRSFTFADIYSCLHILPPQIVFTYRIMNFVRQ